MRVWFVVLLSVGSCAYKNNNDVFDRYIIACHTTDFECFKRQYRSLRDNVLLGNDRFNIPTYEHYIFAYGGGTCIKLTGLQDSELSVITLECAAKRFTLVIDLPLRIHQVKDTIKVCERPNKEFHINEPQTHPLMRFSGNATISVTYPYTMKKKRGSTYMYLEDENLDVILDIPDLSHFHMRSEVEAKLYQWSEWAYEVVQHVDAAENFALPYTRQLRTFLEQIPLNRLISLYPDEDYDNLHFTFSDAAARNNLDLTKN